MKVADIMTEAPHTISANATVGEAVEALADLPFRHLPVVEGRTLVGILSDRDLRSISTPRLLDQDALDEIRARYRSPVTSLMSPDPVSVDNEAELSDVVDVMLENHIGALPVVDAGSGDLLGIVSYVDVLRAAQPRLAD